MLCYVYPKRSNSGSTIGLILDKVLGRLTKNEKERKKEYLFRGRVPTASEKTLNIWENKSNFSSHGNIMEFSLSVHFSEFQLWLSTALGTFHSLDLTKIKSLSPPTKEIRECKGV